MRTALSMQKKTVSKGFSLIELMLVIVVIGMGSLYTLNFIKSKQKEIAIQNTVQKMKDMLQIAQVYHSRYDQWPESREDFVKYFGLSESDFCTQWLGDGKDPATGDAVSACRNRAVIGFLPLAGSVGIAPDKTQDIAANDPRIYPTFYAMLSLPTDELAQDIAAGLPSSDLAGPRLIRASTTARIALPPAEYIYGYVMSGGMVTDGDKVTFPGDCLGNLASVSDAHPMEKHIFFAFKQGLTDFYKKLDWKTKWVFFPVHDPKYRVIYSGTTVDDQQADPPTSVTLKSADCFGSTKSSGSSTCGGSSTDNQKTSSSVVAYYLSLCTPYKQWQVAFDDPTTRLFEILYAQRNSVSGSFMKGYGQCESTWISAGNCNLGTNNPLWGMVI